MEKTISLETRIENIRVDAEKRFLPVMRRKTAALLLQLIQVNRPKRVLEVGTCVGVSSLTVLSEPDLRLTTLELDAERAEEGRKNFVSAGVIERVDLVEGDCFVTLDYLKGNRYDFIILDGSKGHYSELYDAVFPMLEEGGTLFMDDVKYHSLVDKEGTPLHKHRTIVCNMQKFLKKIHSDTRVKLKLYEIEDGVAVAQKLQTYVCSDTMTDTGKITNMEWNISVSEDRE